MEKFAHVQMKNIPFGKPLIGEEEKAAVNAVLSGTTLVHGPRSHEFEIQFAKYTNSRCAVAVSSCTAALHLSYFDLGLGREDEVIVPAMTHNATAHAVELCGAKPVFVDAEKETGNINIDLVESKITKKTKALSVVHYLGLPVDMERVLAIAKRYNLFVVEDCALALGTKYAGKHAGTFGDVGCFSFYPVKHITSAEGGMLITNNPELAARIERKRAFGVDRTPAERNFPGIYDVNMLGFNYRMSEVHAAIGIEQMKRIDGFLQKRKDNFECLSSGLAKLDGIRTFSSPHSGQQSSYYCYSVLLSDRLAMKRAEIVNYLKLRGIGSSIYYPKAVPAFAYYREKYGYTGNEFPVANWIANSSIALPVGPHLDKDDMEYIVSVFETAIKIQSRDGRGGLI